MDLATDIYTESKKSEAFYRYCSEMLRSINNNIAHTFGGNEFPKSWAELLDYKPETRTAKEITTTILDGLQKLGNEE